MLAIRKEIEREKERFLISLCSIPADNTIHVWVDSQRIMIYSCFCILCYTLLKGISDDSIYKILLRG